MCSLDNSHICCLPLDNSPTAETTLKLFVACHGSALVVVSSCKQLYERAQALGCAVLSMSEPGPEQEDGPFPVGSVRALEVLAAVPEYAGRNIMVLDRDLPPLSLETLQSAFEQSGQRLAYHLLPVHEGKDSPCQFKSYFNILAIQCVHLFEGEQGDPGITRPYPCLLESGQSANWLFRDTAVYPPAWKRSEVEFPQFYFHADKDTACLKMRPLDESPHPVGAACGPNGEAIFPLVKAHDNDTLMLHMDPALEANKQYSLWVVPFTETQVSWDAAEELVFFDPVAPLSLSQSVVEGSHGFIIVLLEQALRGGGYDFEMGLRGGEVFDTSIFWESGIPRIKSENRLTGEPISGRQTFPEVVEPFGGFAFFNGRLLADNLCVESLLTDTRSIMLTLDAQADYERQFATFSASRNIFEEAPSRRNDSPVINSPSESMPVPTCSDLVELDRVIDILSAEPAPGKIDSVFMHFFKLAVELRYREINYECTP